MPTIALAMIVRNVEAFLGQCLKSVVPFVDEVIVVDTGSTDRTREVILANAAGAEILEYSPTTHPQSFIKDSPETWPEKLPGPWSGKDILANFGEARQLGLAACKSDYVIWLDSDDVLVNGENLRKVVQMLEDSGHETAMVRYDYETDNDGNVVMTLMRERIVKRRPEVVWCQPIHEVMCPTFGQIAVSEISVSHRRRQYNLPPEIHLRNLKVLLHWFNDKDEEAIDPRMLFYLAIEETWLRPEKALEHYRIYCEKSGSEAERAKAHIYAGRIYETMRPKPNLGAAFAEYAQATLDAPYDPDPFFNAARIAYFLKRWDKCIELTERGFEAGKNISGRVHIFQFNPLQRAYEPHVYYAFSLHTVGRLKEALDVCNEGLKWCPTEPHLLGTKETLEKWFAEEKKRESLQISNTTPIRLSVHQAEPLDVYPMEISTDVTNYFAVLFWKRILVQNNGVVGYEMAQKYLSVLPDGALFETKKKEMAEFLSERRKINAPPSHKTEDEKIEVTSPLPLKRTSVQPGKLDIVFHVGPSWERWSPKTAKDHGIGGSETAVICLSRELALLGHRVTVLSDCGNMAGIYNGVYFIDYQKAEMDIGSYACDVFISSRQAYVLDKPWQFKLSILWVHDIHVGQPTQILTAQLFHFDRFFCLSEWHKNFFCKDTYPFLHPRTIIQTRNGIDTSRFAKTPVKEGNRLIYSSSPDRGLEVLLKVLPAIRAQVPDVKLHVYYGFETWRKMAESAKRSDWLDRIAFFEKELNEGHRRGDLVFHGRVNQTELAEAFSVSKVWSYPTWFSETSCISAMEAQAAGCVPVTTNLAALGETVKHGILIDPPNTSPEYQKIFVESVVKLLTDDNLRESKAKAARHYALNNCDWSLVAVEWLAICEECLRQKEESPLPAFGEF